MSTATIEQLQRIVTDENRPEAERKQAAEHILKLQESNQAASAADDLEQVKRVFNTILGLDGAEERQAIEDHTMQVCAFCFLIQRKANVMCELCGDAAGWLIPSVARSSPEHDMFMRMAANHSIEELKTALQSGWATTPLRERVARLILASRESRVAKQRPDSRTECSDANEQPSVLDSIDLGVVATGYDRALAEIDAKLEALNASHPELPTTGTSA